MPKRRIETRAVCTGAWAQFGVQPWYSAVPLPTALGPPQDVHWTPPTNSVPSTVSSKDAGFVTAPPAAPSKYIAAVLVAGVVAGVVAEVGAVVVAGVVAVPGADVGASFVTVFVVVAPQDASTGRAIPASSRPRPITHDHMRHQQPRECPSPTVLLARIRLLGLGFCLSVQSRLVKPSW